MISLYDLDGITWLELNGQLFDATPTPAGPLPGLSFHGQPRPGLFGDITVVWNGVEHEIRLDGRVLMTASDHRTAERLESELRATLIDDGLVGDLEWDD
jgi:hypothetical protein